MTRGYFSPLWWAHTIAGLYLVNQGKSSYKFFWRNWVCQLISAPLISSCSFYTDYITSSLGWELKAEWGRVWEGGGVNGKLYYVFCFCSYGRNRGKHLTVEIWFRYISTGEARLSTKNQVTQPWFLDLLSNIAKTSLILHFQKREMQSLFSWWWTSTYEWKAVSEVLRGRWLIAQSPTTRTC